MSEKNQVTSVPTAMMGYADYVDPRMVEALRPRPEAMEFLFGRRPQVRLKRRQHLMAHIRRAANEFREKAAFKIAPWLEDRE